VDPALGGNEAFAELSAAAKAHGIRLILDGVFDHTSSDSRYFDRYHRYSEAGACESPSSPFRSWYQISGSDVPCTNYSSFANLAPLPQLDHSNPAVRDFIYRGGDGVVRNWDSRGADGWRLDAAQEMNHGWWTDFRSAVKSYAPDSPLIGEVTAGPVDASPYLVGTELDGVMNYRFRQAAIGFARTLLFTDSSGNIRPLTGTQLDHALKAILEDYPGQAAAVSFNLVDSHDTNRVRFALSEGNDFDAARQRQQLVALLQFTTFGAPMVYYGDEIGISAPGKSGFADPYNRAPFPWPDVTRDPRTAYFVDPLMGDYYARLAAIRHSLPALRAGSLTTLFTSPKVYAFARVAPPDKPVLVVLNKSDRPTQLDIPVRGLYPNGTTLRDKKSSFQTTVTNGRAHVELFQRDGVILVGTS
jgi:glycosidase